MGRTATSAEVRARRLALPVPFHNAIRRRKMSVAAKAMVVVLAVLMLLVYYAPNAPWFP